MRVSAIVVAAMGAAAVAGAGVADAAPRPRGLWATVNVCDTAGSPNAMGVRARMPGNGTRQRMYVRFRAQWFDEASSRWSDVGGRGISRWMRLGSARLRYHEGGYTFAFNPPAEGDRFVLRGLVEYEWRERRRVRRRVRATTKGGVEPSAGSDPPGFSSGLCEVR